MWQTLGQGNGHQSISMVTNDSYALHVHQHLPTHDGEFSPQGPAHHLGEDKVSEFCVPLEEQEDLGGPDLILQDPGGPDLDLGSHMGQEAPHCSQTDMEELRRSCSESQCTSGGAKVSQVEVYPGSGVLCDFRTWHAANQAQSPTAMARTLLLGVFDMNTLISSNLRGGRSRRPTFQPQRNALDPHKINAIFNAILARFPLARKGVIGSGINSKLSEMRFRSRKANRDPRFL